MVLEAFGGACPADSSGGAQWYHEPNVWELGYAYCVGFFREQTQDNTYSPVHCPQGCPHPQGNCGTGHRPWENSPGCRSRGGHDSRAAQSYVSLHSQLRTL